MNLEKILRKAEELGEAELFLEAGQGIVAESDKDRIKSMHSYDYQCLAIRVARRGRIALVYVDDEKKINKALSVLESMLKISKPVKGYHFPEPRKAQSVKTASKDLEALEPQDIEGMLLEAIQGIKEFADPVEGVNHLDRSYQRVLNSSGVDVEERSVSIFGFVEAKKGTGTGSDFWDSGMIDFDPREIGRNAGRWAVINSNAKKQSWKGPFYLHPDVVSDFIDLVLPAMNGELARLKSSPWTGKLGKNVLGGLTLIEDPWIPFAPGSSSFDDEGFPTRKKILVADGVLRGFVYDSVSAKRSRVEPTGNGYRSCHNQPSPGFGNIVIDFRERGEPDGDYLLIKSLMGFHNANKKTGDFSLTLDSGILYKGGEEIPVKGGMLVGNFYRMLSSTELASKQDYRRGDVISPYLLVKDARLVS